MKKILIIAGFFILALGGKATAQDCDYIVSGKFNFDMSIVDNYPRGKYNWLCKFSRNSFYVTNEIPNDAIVFSITDVINIHTQEHLTSDFVVNLDSISVYAYNFHTLQDPNTRKPTYISTPNSQYSYLVVRNYYDALMMTEQESVNDYGLDSNDSDERR